MEIGGVERKKKHTRAFGYYVKRKLNTLTSFPFSFKDVIAELTDVWKWEMTWMKFGYGRKAVALMAKERGRSGGDEEEERATSEFRFDLWWLLRFLQ